ncbi:MAG: ATP-binding protein [Anaerolineaceae bacterium]
MFRLALEKLESWRESPKRKPLIIRGARQVGKTWIMKTFGQSHYLNVAYINFENNERMRNLFKDDFNIERILTGLQIESATVISSETLIIFDEVQEVPTALTSLKYFQENAPEYHILAAGSSLGVLLHQGASFPVGKVDFLDLYPLNFIEFLIATGNQTLVNLMTTQDYALISSFRTKFIDLLRTYYFVGGMPEAVQVYLDTKNPPQVREVQQRLLLAYEQDFSKHAPYDQMPKIRQAWNSMPAQLSRENRKYVYGLIKQGARAREFELALLWLQDSALIHKVFRATKPESPLTAYQANTAFKVFLLDVGLLGALSKLDVISLLGGNEIFMQFKGALTEQYVFQQLISNNRYDLFYWSAENGMAEIDFIIQREGRVYPIEVKAEENLQAKSLKVYKQRFDPQKSIRTSMSDFRDEGWLINIPLYMINLVDSILT